MTYKYLAVMLLNILLLMCLIISQTISNEENTNSLPVITVSPTIRDTELKNLPCEGKYDYDSIESIIKKLD